MIGLPLPPTPSFASSFNYYKSIKYLWIWFRLALDIVHSLYWFHSILVYKKTVCHSLMKAVRFILYAYKKKERLELLMVPTFHSTGTKQMRIFVKLETICSLTLVVSNGKTKLWLCCTAKFAFFFSNFSSVFVVCSSISQMNFCPSNLFEFIVHNLT